MEYTLEQDTFITHSGNESIILSSLAGTGKTRSCVGKLNKMIDDGADPNRIKFFSFTVDAVNELKSRIDHDVNISTIHSFTASMLGKLGLYRPIVTFFQFTDWYKTKFKPTNNTPFKLKMDYQNTIDKFYEDGNQVSSSFSAYKLFTADGYRMPKPKYYDSYIEFLKETKGRDFADMLIECEKLTRNPKYKDRFIGLYDYIFVDEYQDTSTIQMKILLAMKAKQYFLVGDQNQAIFGFAGANANEIETLLKKHHEVIELNLTKNFRSDKLLVEHSNQYSTLKGVAHSQEDGKVHFNLIKEPQLFSMITDDKPLTILARTNKVIKDIERKCLIKKYKMRYFNFITPEDIENISKGKTNPSIKRKLDKVVSYFGTSTNLIKFIQDNQDSETFITSIHKSKGREFPRVVVINSVDPELLNNDNVNFEDYTFITDSGEIDIESKNVHYVAITRSKHEVYFMIYDN